jgi:glycosyltransferase involved in cell wall biosynthesis
MNILFIHPNMPGQYKHLARALGATGLHKIYFITKHKTAEIPGVNRITYTMTKPPAEAKPHRYVAPLETAVRQGQSVWRVAFELSKQTKFVPDIIIGHPGWGDMLYLKDLFPNARMLSFCEYFYRATGADVGFENPIKEDDAPRVRTKNAHGLMNLDMMDWGIAPTVWQWSLNPPEFRNKISVLHDGIDVDLCVPDAQASITLPNGKTFKKGDEVITYIARNFEPYRGFHIFMKAADTILRERPNVHIVAVGADKVSYGQKAPEGDSWREMLTKGVNFPADRMHFTGTLPYAQLLKLFQVSAAHLYLTYPFVLSWGMMEAMACGVPLVASSTKPVLEVVEDKVNGLLADFHKPDEVISQLLYLLDHKDEAARLGAAARRTIVDRFALRDLLPLHMRLVEEVAAGQLPPPVNEAIKRKSPIEPYAKAMWQA